MRTLALLTIAALVFLAGCASAPKASPAQERAATYATKLVGTPYRYGGNSPKRGFDCSGLVQYSFGQAGVKLPHGTTHLRRLSKPISRSQLRRGDLLFFNQEGKRSSHVAIYIGGDRFVHAPSSGKTVHIATFNNYWQKHLNEIRRLDID